MIKQADGPREFFLIVTRRLQRAAWPARSVPEPAESGDTYLGRTGGVRPLLTAVANWSLSVLSASPPPMRSSPVSRCRTSFSRCWNVLTSYVTSPPIKGADMRKLDQAFAK
jgi:hypothetical protein